MLKKQNVTDKQMDGQKTKISISPQKQFSVPFNQFYHLLELRHIDLKWTVITVNLV